MDYSELNLAIIQARLTSTRFPSKVLKKVGEYSIIEIIVKRLERSKLLDKIVLAIPDNESNVKLANFLEQKKILYFKGSEHDVLSRFVECAKFYKATTVVRKQIQAHLSWQCG